MDNHLTRHLIAKLSGCRLDEVARVLQAARYLTTRLTGSGVLDLSADGHCSARLPTPTEDTATKTELERIRGSLTVSLGSRGDAEGFLAALRNPESFVYSGDDEYAVNAAERAPAPALKRASRNRRTN